MASLISYVNSSSNSGSIFVSGSLSCNKPAGTVENDVMIALVFGVSGSTAETVNSVPSGWSTLYSSRIYYKVATGSEPSSYTWGWVDGNNAGIIIGTFRGVNTSDPVGDYDYTSDSSQDGSIVAASIDIETTGNFLLNHNTVRSTISPNPITPPTGSPTFTEYKEADTTGMVIEASYAETTTSGATGSKTATYSYSFGSGYEEGYLIELKQRGPATFDQSASDVFVMSDSNSTTYSGTVSVSDVLTISGSIQNWLLGYAVSWGEENPDVQYNEGNPWSEWMRVDESPPATISGTEWGYLNTYNGIHLGPVYDTTIASGTWTFTLYTDQWQSGQGSGTVYIRGSMTTFSGTDPAPTWEVIESQVLNKAWKYVQLKVEHTL